MKYLQSPQQPYVKIAGKSYLDAFVQQLSRLCNDQRLKQAQWTLWKIWCRLRRIEADNRSYEGA